MDTEGRIVGIQHRVKKTAEQESHPTRVAILSPDGKIAKYELETEQEELDFVKGKFPVSFRDVGNDETLDAFASYQIKWKKLKKEEAEKLDEYPKQLLRSEGKTWYLAKKVPIEYDGLRTGDRVATILGGSGDYFVFAIVNRGEKIGAHVHRITPYVLMDHRKREKEEDAVTLAELFRDDKARFYNTLPRDKAVLRVRECMRLLEVALDYRKRCQQQLKSVIIGKIFCNPEGEFPEGAIEKIYDEAEKNDVVLQNLIKAETTRENELKKALAALDVYTEVFEHIEGIGPRIAARIIDAIVDPRRFIMKDDQVLNDPVRKLRVQRLSARLLVKRLEKAGAVDEETRVTWRREAFGRAIHLVAREKTINRIVKFCGLHVEEGAFPRQKRGERSSWNRKARQAFFLVQDQANRGPDREIGKKFREYKVALRATHPVPVLVQQLDEKGQVKLTKKGKKSEYYQYSDAHIHKMAGWRLSTRLLRKIAKKWLSLVTKKEKNNHRSKGDVAAAAELSNPVQSAAVTTQGTVSWSV